MLFAVFGWSIRGYLFKLPALALYFGIGANLAVLAYMFSFALLESLIIMGVLLAICIILPERVFKEGFAYKAFLTMMVATIGMIQFERYYKVEYFKDIMARNYESIPPFVEGVAACLAALVMLLWMLHRWPRLQKYPLLVMEQVSLFNYIYVPLGVLGLIVVIVRNLP